MVKNKGNYVESKKKEQKILDRISNSTQLAEHGNSAEEK